MLKVFLVEDEIVMREGIKKNIDWEKEGFSFAGEASDGELAFPMIQKLHPDILITDIRMPFMDGRELSRLVKREFPKIKIIILSGYDEFEYAKEAINIGVTEYLLKPMSGAQLLEAVHKVGQTILEEKEQQDFMETYRKERQEAVILEKRNLFRELIDGKSAMSDLIEKGKELDINLAAECYCVVMFQIRPGEDSEAVTDVYSERAINIIHQIESYFEKYQDIQIYEQLGEVIALLLMAQDEEQMKEKTEKCLEELKQIVAGYSDVVYYGGVGSAVRRIREVRQSYQEANRAFSHRFLTDASKIFYTGHSPAVAEGLPEEIDLQEMDIGKLDRKIVLNFLRSGSSSEIEHFAEDFFASLGEENVSSLLFRQYIVMDLYFTVASFLESVGLSKDTVTNICGKFRDGAIALGNRDSTLIYLTQLLEKAIQQRNQISEKKYSSTLEEAKAYIDQNYAREDISLNTVAASVNVSPNHFSTVFSQETGETFIEYLTAVRMEKAKELLRSTSLKSSEVGYQVGYKDPHYFSYLFKKTQNMTPREFRTDGAI